MQQDSDWLHPHPLDSPLLLTLGIASSPASGPVSTNQADELGEGHADPYGDFVGNASRWTDRVGVILKEPLHQLTLNFRGIHS